ncbi:hypothetical protein M3172_19380 [Mesobacillus subterraneus]|uniref:hypothetical protein n=1 Tax=Mesobacillus subterraneus TaxID=285983 RepID=UPI00203C58E9|nr:hypothetical protein [Mesobacillus subterraneus]MCM3575366.1 hypothetical protein [Mesobacillus subterraneus]
MEKQNPVAKVLRIIGFAVMIGGFILAAIEGPVESDGGYNGGMTLTVLFSSFVTGMLFIGFSEVIALLQKIYLRLSQNSSSDHAMSNDRNEIEEPQVQKDWQLSPLYLDAIHELYPGQNVKILATPFEDYCVVQIEGEENIEVLELGGFKPMKITADSEPKLFHKIQEWFSNRPSQGI